MANHHFGKLADVWKHLVLAEVLAADRPERLFDTHAGHAVYAMTTDPERRYGVSTFIGLASSDTTLASSRYFRLLERQVQNSGKLAEYPAGPMVSMVELGQSCEYWFCDLDPDSTADVSRAAADLGLEHRVHVVHGDGMTAADDALDLCRKAADLGAAVICWYGYDRADQRNWLSDDVRERSSTPWWCGDIMVNSAGADLSAGDLGVATSPGTGFGLACANVSSPAMHRCDQLGTALARAYRGRSLPDGRVGVLEFDSTAGF